MNEIFFQIVNNRAIVITAICIVFLLWIIVPELKAARNRRDKK